ncbi:sigma factor regulatory protein, FecR/PupR family [Bacteriovorax sp. BSW11_IV]|uniref:FecR family protein n=1 Tax=Bacteriovorax sp. BSW11_IV TaxID=1353529 RepID=UPI00038A07B2|nr:FecR family protein [Bacteriovorax sp. BSW11_IV]EQC48381.1 sigma factor regulatory protein, FecR/PupR family [Bacteriovorax sp. BSW11_IV]
MKYTLLFLFFISQWTYANVEVIKVRGEAFIQKENSLIHIKAKDKFENGTIFKTGEKSLLVVKVKNGQFTLRPNSETQISAISNSEITFVNLLKGQIRAQINQRESKEIKTIIKTKSVAIGVRGTDFITSYNDTNLSTGVLGFTGETAVVKVPEDELMAIENYHPEIVLTEFEQSDSITLSQGIFSQVFIGDSPIELYNTDPKQISALSDNEISYHQKNSDGLVDLETNFFITNDDENNNVGTFDKKDGSYIPPEGLRLDPLEGFVHAFKENIDKLKELQERLNTKIEDKIFRIKDLTSLVSKIESYYHYSNTGIEDHFSQWRNIQKIDLHQFILKGDIHHLTYKSEYFEWTPRLYGELYLNNHQKNKMARNYDNANFGGAFDFKAMYDLFGKKAQTKATVSGGFIYKDLKAKGSISYYAGHLYTSLGNSINYYGQKRVGLKIDLRFFETQESEEDVGHILGIHSFIDFFKNNSSSLRFKLSLMRREHFYKSEIFENSLIFKKFDLFRKTDFISTYSFHKQNDRESKLYQHLLGIRLERRKGPFLRYFTEVEYGALKTNESLNPINFSIGVKGLF